mmetsp:Transcript_97/g.237  ORF Transcript_97/g.237 Transcript_97/m.237 type:complete len:276 (+) Transcript_97:783-1610(+)
MRHPGGQGFHQAQHGARVPRDSRQPHCGDLGHRGHLRPRARRRRPGVRRQHLLQSLPPDAPDSRGGHCHSLAHQEHKRARRRGRGDDRRARRGRLQAAPPHDGDTWGMHGPQPGVPCPQGDEDPWPAHAGRPGERHPGSGVSRGPPQGGLGAVPRPRIAPPARARQEDHEGPGRHDLLRGQGGARGGARAPQQRQALRPRRLAGGGGDAHTAPRVHDTRQAVPRGAAAGGRDRRPGAAERGGRGGQRHHRRPRQGARRGVTRGGGGGRGPCVFIK